MIVTPEKPLMKRKSFRVLVYLALGVLIVVGAVLEVQAQRGGRGGGGGRRPARTNSSVNRG